MVERGCAIAVMAKAPRVGRVKTRLAPPLTAAQAAALGAAFLSDVTANIARAGAHAAIRGFVAYAPAGDEALFDGVVAPGTGLVLADGAPPAPAGVEGFGRSLLHAAQALFAQGFGSVCLLNADSPDLPTSILVALARALEAPGDRVVLGPSEDGGYYVLGLKAPHARLFQDVRWSTATVAAETRARAADLSLEVVELPEWYDVDDAPSLRRLMAQIADPARADPAKPAPFAAPATVGCIARLGIGEASPTPVERAAE